MQIIDIQKLKGYRRQSSIMQIPKFSETCQKFEIFFKTKCKMVNKIYNKHFFCRHKNVLCFRQFFHDACHDPLLLPLYSKTVWSGNNHILSMHIRHTAQQ